MMVGASTTIMTLLILVEKSLGTLHELTSNISIIFLKPSSASSQEDASLGVRESLNYKYNIFILSG